MYVAFLVLKHRVLLLGYTLLNPPQLKKSFYFVFTNLLQIVSVIRPHLTHSDVQNLFRPTTVITPPGERDFTYPISLPLSEPPTPTQSSILYGSDVSRVFLQGFSTKIHWSFLEGR